MKKTRRPGATETIGVSLDAVTKRAIKALAAERHDGNVSALITEMTAHELERAAFARAWAWYGGRELSEKTRAKIDRELDEGWSHARKSASKSRRRRAA